MSASTRKVNGDLVILAMDAGVIPPIVALLPEEDVVLLRSRKGDSL